MKKKIKLMLHNIFFYILSGVMAIIVVGILFYLFIKLPLVFSRKKDYDYFSAKEAVIKYLDENINDLELYSNLVLENKPKKCVDYYDISYCYGTSDNKEYVSISVGSQGFLGGQYWGLIYSKDDILNGKTIDIYDDKYGKNYFIKRKIKDNWYFTYDDYDEKVDITSVS